MISYAKKLAASAAVLGILVSGAAVPASAASPLDGIQLPSISWPWGEQVAVESIEAGEYSAAMTVGTTQQLSPVVLPENASNKSVSYSSSDESILKVSGRGLVQAVAVGKASIAAKAGDVTIYYDIAVQTDPSGWVTEMDLTLSASRIAVGDTASVGIQVLPSDATNTADLTLTSSNPEVASVNNFGKITGVSAGKATITATCGDVTASADITVIGSANGEAITLNSNYIVLKPGGTFALKASVTPSSASQRLTYKTNDASVAAVSSAGVITATGTGATSIIVSNGSASALASVIVNRTAAAPSDTDGGAETPDTSPETADEIAEAIRSASGAEVVMQQSSVPVLTTERLEALRTSGKTLVLTADNYTMSIDGAKLKNTSNELSTSIVFEAADNGTEFTLNAAEPLPGEVSISLTGGEAAYRSLYLYNGTTSKWQYLNTYSSGEITADSAGRYLLTNETLNTIGVNWYFLGAAAVVVVAIGVVYIAFKKRYWFW